MKLFTAYDPSEASKYRWSVAALVVANLFPLFGVLALGWKTFDVVLLYWLENVVIGVINLPRMLLAWGAKGKQGAFSKVAEKLFNVPFFCFHYGMFCMGHGAFLFDMLTPEGHPQHGEASRTFIDLQVMRDAVVAELSPWQWVTIGVLAASHLVSLGVNYLGRGEWRERQTTEVMFLPYGRVILLHVAILVGGLLAQWLGSPVFVLVLLVAGKTLLDYGLHIAEHEAAATRRQTISPAAEPTKPSKHK